MNVTETEIEIGTEIEIEIGIGIEIERHWVGGRDRGGGEGSERGRKQ